MKKYVLFVISVFTIICWDIGAERPSSQTPVNEFRRQPVGTAWLANSILKQHVQADVKSVAQARSDAGSVFAPVVSRTLQARRVAVSVLPPEQDAPDTEPLLSNPSDEAALVAWKEEKNAFYRDELLVSEEEIAAIDALVEDVGMQIRQIVKKMDDVQLGQSAQATLHLQLSQKLKLLDDQVFAVLGQERYNRAVAFRSQFNMAVKERFDAELKFTGF